MKFPQHSLSRQAMSDRPEGAAGAMPRLSGEAALNRRVIDSLVTGRAHVLVSSSSGDLLVRWGRSIAAVLRKRADLSLEIYMPSTAEALVARFNSAIATMSLEMARADAPGEEIRRVLLVTDSRSLLPPEGLLLMRLVNEFPALGLRLMVLADDDAVDAKRTLREIFAHRLHCLALDSVQTHPIADPLVVNQRVEEPLPDGPRSHSGLGRAVTWVAALLSLLLICALVVVLLHRDRTPAGADRSLSRAVSSSAVPTTPSPLRGVRP